MNHLRQYHRTGHFEKVVDEGRQIDSGSPGYAEAQITVAMARMEMGQFDRSAEGARIAADQCSNPTEALALQLVAAYAEMIARPSLDNRDQVSLLADKLVQSEEIIWQAIAKRWKSRLIMIEISFQSRSITAIGQSCQLLADSAALFRMANRQTEAREQLALMADFIEKGPPADSERAHAIRTELLEESLEANDLPLIAKLRLALAEDAMEKMLAGHENAPDRAEIEDQLVAVAESYRNANILGDEAPLLAAKGRKWMRYAKPEGAEWLRQAGEKWEEVGRLSSASGTWGDLLKWHQVRGDREQVDELNEKIQTRNPIKSQLTTDLNRMHRVFNDLVGGDLAPANQTAAAAGASSLVPQYQAGFLIQESSSLLARNDREAARVKAEQAVAILKPAAPCVFLGEALFWLGNVHSDPEEKFRLFEEAAQSDLDCDMKLSATARYANMGEFLTQPNSIFSSEEWRQRAEGYYRRAEVLLGNARDAESLAALGSLAQRRGMTASRQHDFVKGEDFLMQAENHFRAIGHNASLAYVYAQRGFMLMEVARLEKNGYWYAEANKCFEEAGGRFERHDLRGEQYRMWRLSAATAWEGGNYQEGEEQKRLYELAAERYEDAYQITEILRIGRRESELPVRQASREDLAKMLYGFFEEAARFFFHVMAQADRGFLWLERMKTRALLEEMTVTPSALVVPNGADARLVAEEKKWMTVRDENNGIEHLARKQRNLASQRLEVIWNEMAKKAETTGYVALRRGHPVAWPEWREALRRESADPRAGEKAVVSVHFIWPLRKNSPIELVVSKHAWDQPRWARTKVLSEDVESFARQCFQAGSRACLFDYLDMTGDNDGWCERFSALLAPLAEWTDPGDVLLLIPQGGLHGLPLHALHLNGTPLIDRNPVCLSPSASVMMFVWERIRHTNPRAELACAAVVGCATPGGGLNELRRAHDEARFVADIPVH